MRIKGASDRVGQRGDAVIDDYLKTIYAHTEWQDLHITPSQLASKLGLAPSSVTEMAKKLSALGLLVHVPYAPIRLSDSGTARAIAVVRRHRLIETWLVEVMGYRWDEVHEDAEVLEHSVSARLIEAIDAQLGHPRWDPHGDAIPTAAGSVTRRLGVRLADAEAGHRGQIIRVSDTDPEVLQHLADVNVRLGDVLVVEAHRPTPHSVKARVGDDLIVFEPKLADAMWIAV